MITVNTFTTIINQLLPDPHAGLLNGILFGTKATLDKNFLDALTKTGTLHIVALSGMNITIIASITATLLQNLISKRLTSLLTVIFIIGFILFVGPSPSVIRAGIMGSIGLIAVVFGKQLWSILSLALAVGTMLLLHPLWLGELSFQLSALATLGIILFGGKSYRSVAEAADKNSKSQIPKSKQIPNLKPQNSKRLKHLNLDIGNCLKLGVCDLGFGLVFLFRNVIEDNLRVTLAAQVFTIPLILLTFQRISLISPLPNVLIGPVIPIVTGMGFAVVALGMLWLPLGQVAAWATWVWLEYMIQVIMITSKIPMASVGW